MPLYEFQCEACHKKQELMLKMSDPPPEKCPLCGGQPFRKLISRTAFVLQGGGWYSQGYTGPSNSSSSKSEDKSETKTETPKTSTETTPKSE